MECLFGFKGKDFVLIAVDPITTNSIIKIDPYNKFISHNNILMCCAGEQADYSRTTNYVIERLKYESNLQIPFNLTTTATLLRNEIYNSLRRNSLKFNSLITDGNSLVGVDMNGCLINEKRIALGYAMYFLYGLFDLYYSESINKEDAILLCRKAIKTLKEVFVLNIDHLDVKIVSSEGIESLSVKYGE